MAALLCLSVSASRVWAQGEAPNPAKVAARAKLLEGDGLLKRGEYQQALAAFKEAFALYPSPKIQYDFGLAYQGMGRNAEALDAFEAFLLGASDAQPDVQAKARAARDDLRTRVGLLRVAADVDGAAIVVDGREMGKTPQAREIRVDPGPHLVLIDPGAGAPSFTQRLDVAAGATVSVVARLKTIPAPAPPAASQPAMRADAAGATPTPDAMPQPGRSWRVAGIATASAGVVCLGAGLLFGLAAHSAAQDVSNQYSADRDRAGKRDATLQWVGYGVGAAAVAAGALLFVHGGTAGANETGDAPPTVHAYVVPGRLFVEGRF